MRTRIFLTVLMIGTIMGAIAQNPAKTLTFTAGNNSWYVPLAAFLKLFRIFS